MISMVLHLQLHPSFTANGDGDRGMADPVCTRIAASTELPHGRRNPGASGPAHARRVCAQVADPRADMPLREARVDKEKRVDSVGHYTVERMNNRIDLTPLGMDLVLRRLRARPGLLPTLPLLVLRTRYGATACLLDVLGCALGCSSAGPSCGRCVVASCCDALVSALMVLLSVAAVGAGPACSGSRVWGVHASVSEARQQCERVLVRQRSWG